MSGHSLQLNGTKVLLDGVVVNAPFLVQKAWYDDRRNQVIVLMEYTAQQSIQQFRNLVAYSLNNKQMWEAELPTTSGVEAYVDADIDNEELRAFSFSCFRCLINLDNGKIKKKTFAK